jgi:hypothetical protein
VDSESESGYRSGSSILSESGSGSKVDDKQLKKEKIKVKMYPQKRTSITSKN